MNTELTMLAWTLVVAVVQIMLPAFFATKDHGLGYNMGARDEPVGPPSKLAGRLARAQHNLAETLPIFAAAVLIAHVAGRESNMTAWGAELYLIARIVYIPLYAFGVPVLRSLVWTVSMVGLIMVLAAVLGA